MQIIKLNSGEKLDLRLDICVVDLEVHCAANSTFNLRFVVPRYTRYFLQKYQALPVVALGYDGHGPSTTLRTGGTPEKYNCVVDTGVSGDNLLEISSPASCDINIKVYLEENAQASIKGGYILSGDDKVKINIEQMHNGRNSKSDVVVKGVLDGSAKAEYIGKIFVAKSATLTNASQENKNIILSPNAKAFSIPSLEVLTDDVKCKHATASSYINSEHLFYLASRGLSLATSKALILDAFLKDVL